MLLGHCGRKPDETLEGSRNRAGSQMRKGTLENLDLDLEVRVGWKGACFTCGGAGEAWLEGQA